MDRVKLNTPTITTSEEKYRFLFQNLHDAAVLVDVETGIIQETNIQGTVLLGRSYDEIVGLHFLQLHPKNQAKLYKRGFARHVKLGPSADFDGEVLSKDGTTIPVNITACNLVVNGRHLILGLFHDITRRQKAEEALKQTTSMYRELFKNADVGILLSDLKGKIVKVNQFARNLSGYSNKEILNLDVYELLFIGEDLFCEEMKLLLERGESIKRRFELELLRKNGIRVPVEATLQLIIQDRKPTGFHTMLRDITRQKRLKENMQFYISQIIKGQEEERKRIARDLHDETVQSLATLALRIQAIATTKLKLPEEIRGSLEECRVKTSMIQDQVRHFSHELRPDVLDYLGLIPALRALMGELQNDGINGKMEITGVERRLSNEAELAFFRIAQEALNNVRKHSEATKVVLKIKFSAKNVGLSINDNGKGFKLPEIATDFARRGKLGLIGIRERVRLLNGTLTITTHPGKGSTIAIEADV